MSCIDKNMEPIDVEERAHSFVFHKMPDDQEIRFMKHLDKCESCSDLVDQYFNLSRFAEISKLNDKLEKAIEDGDDEKANMLRKELSLIDAGPYANKFYNDEAADEALQIKMKEFAEKFPKNDHIDVALPLLKRKPTPKKEKKKI